MARQKSKLPTLVRLQKMISEIKNQLSVIEGMTKLAEATKDENQKSMILTSVKSLNTTVQIGKDKVTSVFFRLAEEVGDDLQKMEDFAEMIGKILPTEEETK